MIAYVALALAAVALGLELVVGVALYRFGRTMRGLGPAFGRRPAGSFGGGLAAAGVVPRPADDEGAPPLVDEELASS